MTSPVLLQTNFLETFLYKPARFSLHLYYSLKKFLQLVVPTLTAAELIMAKFFTFFAIFAFYIFETTIAQSQAYPNYIQQDIKWTRAINAKLCSPNGHHEAIAQQFYACYNEGIVPVSTISENLILFLTFA